MTRHAPRSPARLPSSAARRLVVGLTACTLAAAPAQGRGAPASDPVAEPADTLADLYTRGEERFHAGDLDGAIEAFALGLSRIEADGPPRLRAYFSVSLAIAHLDRFDASADPTDLERAHELLVATVDRDAATLRVEPRLEALARRNLDRAQSRLAAAADPEGAASPDEGTRPPLEPEPDASVSRVETPSEPPPEAGVVTRRRAAAIGLLVSGTALVVGGIAVVIDGATLERRARAIAEDPPMGRQKEYIDNEVPRLARIRYAIAGPALAIGVGLLVAGGVLLAPARSRPRRATVRPVFAPGHAGVSVRGRF